MATGVCVLLSVCVGVCAAFNLDTSFPLLKRGEDGSLFGLSVALHQDLETHRYLLLVGAPREKAEPNVPANRTGGVYSCPITADQSDCRRMKLIDPDLNLSEDLVEDMWLGVSVASQGRPGGRVLACGHRFVKLYGALKLRHMIGRCYLRGNNLEYDEGDMHWQNPDQPCRIFGAPKDSKEDARGSVLLAVKQSKELRIEQTLRGEQMGSYFGNAVATADLDNDG
eukprot:superscaffoldBa00008183_g23146